MSDHYQTAIDWVSAAEQDPQHNTPENLAIAEAVLALAEQQRIANLIALYVGDSKSHPAGGEIGDDCYSRLADPDVRAALTVDPRHCPRPTNREHQ